MIQNLFKHQPLQISAPEFFSNGYEYAERHGRDER